MTKIEDSQRSEKELKKLAYGLISGHLEEIKKICEEHEDLNLKLFPGKKIDELLSEISKEITAVDEILQ